MYQVVTTHERNRSNDSVASDRERVDAAVMATQAFCASRIPDVLGDQIRLDVSRRGRSITIHEARPPWDPDRMGPEWTTVRVAQLRYDASSKTWALYCSDSGGRWWSYEEIEPTPSVDPLLAEIDRDPTGIFWG
jgi:Protein of unknown function (DUF3024)